MYYIGLAVAIGILVIKFGWPLYKKYGKIFGSFHRNPKGSDLSPEELGALQVGAVHGEQNSFYIDSLKTGIAPDVLAEMLAEGWSVRTREEAVETIEWLMSDGHRRFYPGVYAIISKGQDPAAAVESLFDEESRGQALSFYNNLKSSMEQLKEDIDSSEADYERGILAWDMSRAVLLARSGCDCGFLTEAEAWEYIKRADAVTRETFSSWKELRQSLIIGRAMWNGYGSHLDGFINISEDLLTKEKSPWMRYPF